MEGGDAGVLMIPVPGSLLPAVERAEWVVGWIDKKVWRGDRGSGPTRKACSRPTTT